MLARLEDAVGKGLIRGAAVAEAMWKAINVAAEWMEAHPVYVTMIAISVLVLLSPWAIGALRFKELGLIRGIARHSLFLVAVCLM